MRSTTLFALCLGTVVADQVLPDSLENDARQQLYTAYVAGCDKEGVERWDCKWCQMVGLEKLYGVAETVEYGGQAYVARVNGSRVVVSFRGSKNARNWIEDFDFEAVPLTWEGVPQGHSLGAAEACLCVTDFRLQGLSPYMWSFGEPRVGDPQYAAFFNNQTTHPVYRMVNERDIVPHLPTQDLGFRHHAHEVWRAPNGTYYLCNGSGEDKTCSDSIPFVELTGADHNDYMGLNDTC